MSRLLEEVIKIHAIHLENHKMDFKSHIEKDCYANVSKEEMMSVFNNLLTNAIKYTADKTITVQLYKEEDRCQFVFEMVAIL